MSPRDIVTAKDFHESTKLSYINLDTKPPLYKDYKQLPSIGLSVDLELPNLSAVDTISGFNNSFNNDIGLQTISKLLYYSAGVIRTANHPTAGEVHYRAAASAGALYPVETYLLCQDLEGIPAGVYHFAPHEFALRLIRPGDYRKLLTDATAGNQHICQSPATLIFTTLFWRSTWKYRSRGYRYCYWDTGTVISNLLSTATACQVSTELITGFVDSAINDILSIDGVKESAACLIPLSGTTPYLPVNAPPELEPVESNNEQAHLPSITYPELEALHQESSLITPQEVLKWRAKASRNQPESSSTTGPKEPTHNYSKSVSETIINRGSTRRFSNDSIPLDKFLTVINNGIHSLPTDFSGSERDQIVDLYVIVNSVENLTSGSYFYSIEKRQLELLKSGDFRDEAGHLGFEQALPSDASAVFFFMGNLENIIDRCGSRGYRIAQMESGILGGNLYLGMHSLGFGATGLTFYDDDVTKFFSPHAQNKSPLFVVPVGIKHKQNIVTPFRSKVASKLDALARGAGHRLT